MRIASDARTASTDHGPLFSGTRHRNQQGIFHRRHQESSRSVRKGGRGALPGWRGPRGDIPSSCSGRPPDEARSRWRGSPPLPRCGPWPETTCGSPPQGQSPGARWRPVCRSRPHPPPGKGENDRKPPSPALEAKAHSVPLDLHGTETRSGIGDLLAVDPVTGEQGESAADMQLVRGMALPGKGEVGGHGHAGEGEREGLRDRFAEPGPATAGATAGAPGRLDNRALPGAESGLLAHMSILQR